MYKIVGGDNKEYGPLTAEQIRQWIAEGRLNGQTSTRLDGTSEWKTLAAFPEFTDALASQTAARPPIAATPEKPAELANQILSREPQLRIGECLSGGFSFLMSNAGFVLASVLIVWVIYAFKTMVAFVPVVGSVLSLLVGLAYWLLGGVLVGGLYLACLRRLRGEPASAANVFDGFKLCFVQLMLAGALTKLLTQIGFAFCVIPGIYLLIAWTFALPLVADKRLEFWSAMELSRKVVNRVWFEVFLLLLIVFLPFLLFQTYAGVKMARMILEIVRDADFDFLRLATTMQERLPEIMAASFRVALMGLIVLFFNLLYAVGVMVHAYENLFGARKA